MHNHDQRSAHATAAAGAAPAPRRLEELSRDDALALLASVPLGRIVFTVNALPAIRPVNHVVENGEVIIRTHGDSAIATHTAKSGIGGIVVAYEADEIDPVTHLGWSVVVTGYARQITDPGQLAHYNDTVAPWVEHTMDQAVRIRPDMVNGFRLTESPQ
jgi:nitroimidazol reductase NimA-like FMN-containing flavoprotein (pyridoxamine 5'-phosphate oxidase superfamily)